MAARVTVTPTDVSGKYPTLPVVITQLAADATNLNQIALTGREILIARNTHATDPFTFTVSSTAHPVTNRTGDISAYSIAAGVEVMVGPLASEGWSQGGYLYFQAEAADVVFKVIRVPG